MKSTSHFGENDGDAFGTGAARTSDKLSNTGLTKISSDTFWKA
jgi:hypothetical protein